MTPNVIRPIIYSVRVGTPAERGHTLLVEALQCSCEALCKSHAVLVVSEHHIHQIVCCVLPVQEVGVA